MAIFDDTLLSRIEDASLNASAPPQQRWMDGWLLRLNPGKAKRARCINALAPGRQPLDFKLQQAQAAFDEAGLPLVMRVTRFSQPPSLDADLAARGYTVLDDTRVMVLQLADLSDAEALHQVPPAGLRWQAVPSAEFAEIAGELRGSSAAQRQAHAQRLLASPVPYQAFAWTDTAAGSQVLCCGQFALEGDLVGLYDVYSREAERRRSLASLLCKRLLSLSALSGAKTAYLQVEADNHAARSIYTRMGFVDGYRYHYRQRPA